MQKCNNIALGPFLKIRSTWYGLTSCMRRGVGRGGGWGGEGGGEGGGVGGGERGGGWGIQLLTTFITVI